MRKQWRWMAAALVLAAAGACGRDGGGAGGGGATKEVAGDSGPPPGELPTGVTKAQGTEGRTLYRAACVMCHGEAGQGTQLGASLVDAEWSEGSGTFDEIAKAVEEGVAATEEHPAMPPRGNGTFTEAQVRAVSAYTYSLARRGGAPAQAPAKQ